MQSEYNGCLYRFGGNFYDNIAYEWILRLFGGDWLYLTTNFGLCTLDLGLCTSSCSSPIKH